MDIIPGARLQKEMPKDQWLVDLIVECQQQMQSDLRYPACSPLDPAAERESSESQGASACHAQDQPACADSTAKNVYSAQEKCIQITNLLQRAFEQCKPNSFWATDIAYIPTPKGMLYIYAVIDLCGRMVLAYRIGGNIMSASLVTQRIRDALITGKGSDGLSLHSDQGSQYTSSAHFDLVQRIPTFVLPCPVQDLLMTTRP